MKDEKAKYLIIDSMEIHKQLYKITKEFAFNDFYNIYEPNGKVDASKIFENNGIPKEFQKIIVKVNIPFFLKNEAEEYMLGFPFDITAGKIETENEKKFITVSNSPVYDYYANQEFKNKIKFRTQLVYSRFDDVMNFLLMLDDKGYLKPYLRSIKEFFEISINLDLIDEAWEESKENPKLALKIYKKKLSNKK